MNPYLDLDSDDDDTASLRFWIYSVDRDTPDRVYGEIKDLFDDEGRMYEAGVFESNVLKYYLNIKRILPGIPIEDRINFITRWIDYIYEYDSSQNNMKIEDIFSNVMSIFFSSGAFTELEKHEILNGSTLYKDVQTKKAVVYNPSVSYSLQQLVNIYKKNNDRKIRSEILKKIKEYLRNGEIPTKKMLQTFPDDRTQLGKLFKFYRQSDIASLMTKEGLRPCEMDYITMERFYNMKHNDLPQHIILFKMPSGTWGSRLRKKGMCIDAKQQKKVWNANDAPYVFCKWVRKYPNRPGDMWMTPKVPLVKYYAIYAGTGRIYLTENAKTRLSKIIIPSSNKMYYTPKTITAFVLKEQKNKVAVGNCQGTHGVGNTHGNMTITPYDIVSVKAYNTKFNYIVRRPKPPAKKSTPSPIRRSPQVKQSPIRRSPQVKQSSVRRSPTKNTQCLAITKTTNKRCSRKICSGCSKYCKTHSKMSK